MTAGTFDARVASFIVGPLYAGLEANVGLGGTRGVVIRESPKASVSDDSLSAAIGVGGLVGVAGRAGRLQPHAELFAGARMVAFQVDSEVERSCGNCVRNLSAVWGVVSPRAGLDIWIHPLVTAGAWAGFDLLHRDDFAAGIRFGFHLRSFDGR